MGDETVKASKTLMSFLLVLATSGICQAAPLVASQKSLVTDAEIDEALQEAAEKDEALRQQVRSTLESEEVRRLAAKIGLESVTLDKAAAAVDGLQGPELEKVAQETSQLQEALAGGETITISLVALLLIVIIVILLA